MSHQVHLLPIDVTFEVKEGETVLELRSTTIFASHIVAKLALVPCACVKSYRAR